MALSQRYPFLSSSRGMRSVLQPSIEKGSMMLKFFLATTLFLLNLPILAEPTVQPPILEHVFTVTVSVAPPVEMGEADGGRKRFIAITGGKVEGPRLTGDVLSGGGDWQVIETGGLARLEARYFLKASDGTVIEVTNLGVRVASSEVTERLAKGEVVDPSEYYFRTSPSFKVASGKHDWLRRNVFVARGVRKPDRVVIEVFLIR